jgi:hypothetical protein
MAIDVLPAAAPSRLVWQKGDGLRLRLNGKVALDASDAEDVTMFDSLTPDRDVELRVAVVVGGMGVEWQRSREGDVCGVVATKVLSLQSIWPSD